MKPAWSILLFTTIAGAAQGMVVALAVLCLSGMEVSEGVLRTGLMAAALLLILALIASFFHLGHPLRAWRAALMWRTSWMSREVIVLPAFICLVLVWALLLDSEASEAVLEVIIPSTAVLAAVLLWYCTAMIYACIKFIQEWAHPVTVVNYTLLGVSSGLLLTCALFVVENQTELLATLGPWTIAATMSAWMTRAWSLRRNASLKAKSSLQSATGIRSDRLVQKSMGMTGGSFNTREFFHRASLAAMRRCKMGFQILAFAVPVLLCGAALYGNLFSMWLIAPAVQFVGLLAERWYFFAQARHPQNLYYQTVA